MGYLALLLNWLAGLTVAKTVLSLGIGLLTFGGYLLAVDQLRDLALSTYGGLPVAILAYADIAGVPLGMGYVVAAVVMRAAFDFMPRIGALS